MIVVDASVLVGVVAEDGGAARQTRLEIAGKRMLAPEVVDLEVASAVRRGRARLVNGAAARAGADRDAAMLGPT